MKRPILFLLLVLLAAQFSCKIAPVLAQEQEEDNRAAALEVVKAFYESTEKGDYNSALQQISPNFSCVINGEKMDYNRHKAYLKDSLELNYKRFLRFSLYNVRVNLEGSGDSAIAEVDFYWKGYDSIALVDKTGYRKRVAHLAKENGVWKITCLGPLDPPSAQQPQS